MIPSMDANCLRLLQGIPGPRLLLVCGYQSTTCLDSPWLVHAQGTRTALPPVPCCQPLCPFLADVIRICSQPFPVQPAHQPLGPVCTVAASPISQVSNCSVCKRFSPSLPGCSASSRQRAGPGLSLGSHLPGPWCWSQAHSDSTTANAPGSWPGWLCHRRPRGGTSGSLWAWTHPPGSWAVLSDYSNCLGDTGTGCAAVVMVN